LFELLLKLSHAINYAIQRLDSKMNRTSPIASPAAKADDI